MSDLRATTGALSEQQQDFQRRALRPGLVDAFQKRVSRLRRERAFVSRSLDAVTRIDLTREILLDRKTNGTGCGSRV